MAAKAAEYDERSDYLPPIADIVNEEMDHHRRVCFDNGVVLSAPCGKGGQAIVFKGTLLPQAGGGGVSKRVPVAIKIQPVSISRARQGMLDKPMNWLLRMQPSKYVCRLMSVFQAPSSIRPKRIMFRYIITELCPGEDALQPTIKRSHHPKWADRCLSEDEVRPIIYGMLKSLQHLHGQGAIHRDIKPENGMWDPKTMTFKLIDFGHMLLCEPGEAIQRPNQASGAGTRFYRAPESLLGYYSAACDSWGVGVSMFTLLFAYVPFQYYKGQELPTADEADAVLRGFTPEVVSGVGPHFPKSIPCGRTARDLMAGLLDSNVQTRTTIDKALTHPWFDPVRERM